MLSLSKLVGWYRPQACFAAHPTACGYHGPGDAVGEGGGGYLNTEGKGKGRSGAGGGTGLWLGCGGDGFRVRV